MIVRCRSPAAPPRGLHHFTPAARPQPWPLLLLALNAEHQKLVQDLTDQLEVKERAEDTKWSNAARASSKGHGRPFGWSKTDGSARSASVRRAGGLAASRLSSQNASTCSAPLSAEKACRQCRDAGGGTCKPAFGWSWTAPLQVNDGKTSIPGLRGVRGMAALNEPGVSVLAQWRQNNWPALVAQQPVRTASEADRQRMCRLWASEHSYQSWPVLLGCPGRQPREFEPACANTAAVVEVRCALMDLAAGREVLGDIYDTTRWFRASHWMHPPEPCKSVKTVRMPKIASALSVYPFAMGHFVPEQLPAVLTLHAVLPPDVPILVLDAPIVRRYLTPLIEVGAVPEGRLLFHKQERAGPMTIRADAVYLHLNSHFSNVMSGDAAMRVARDTYALVGRGVYPKRHVLLVDRGGGARRLLNHNDVKAVIDKAIENMPGSSAGGRQVGWRTRRGSKHHDIDESQQLSVVNWRPSSNVSHDIDAFRQAALIVAPHGAGLSNMLFATEGTPVIEICYDSRNGQVKEMLCPAMYAAMAVNLNLPYWVVTAHGTYITGLRVDLVQLRTVVEQALAITASAPMSRACPATPSAPAFAGGSRRRRSK